MENMFFDSFFQFPLAVAAVWNFAVFVMYGTDKLWAKTQHRRISEKTLLISAFLLGGIGAFLGMQIFRHKTRHVKFIILVPVAAVLTIAVLARVGYIVLI